MSDSRTEIKNLAGNFAIFLGYSKINDPKEAQIDRIYSVLRNNLGYNLTLDTISALTGISKLKSIASRIRELREIGFSITTSRSQQQGVFFYKLNSPV